MYWKSTYSSGARLHTLKDTYTSNHNDYSRVTSNKTHANAIWLIALWLKQRKTSCPTDRSHDWYKLLHMWSPTHVHSYLRLKVPAVRDRKRLQCSTPASPRHIRHLPPIASHPPLYCFLKPAMKIAIGRVQCGHLLLDKLDPPPSIRMSGSWFPVGRAPIQYFSVNLSQTGPMSGQWQDRSL